MTAAKPINVAIVPEAGREDPGAARRGEGRFGPLVTQFRQAGANAFTVPYQDADAPRVAAQLLTADAVLVFVNPLHNGQDRSVLDPMLRQVAAAGVMVSAHPDTIVKLGTKEVLVRTQHMGWSAGDVHAYRSRAEMEQALPDRLTRGPRVLKRGRGNGGQGVWRVDLVEQGRDSDGPLIQVSEARGGARPERMALATFAARVADVFAREGVMVDQPYHDPRPNGMVRCYLTANTVVGFGHQYVTALTAPDPNTPPPPSSARLYFDEHEPRFQSLRTRMEQEWLPALAAATGVRPEDLPIIWDADFFWETGSDGEDLFWLGEINVSAVHPYPDSALAPMVAEALARVNAWR